MLVFRSSVEELVLQTDPLDRSWGKCGDDSDEHTIGYYSRNLLPREEHYSAVEDRLAIQLGVAAFSV